MKKYLFYLLSLLFSITALAQNNLVFVEANEAYNKGDYKKATGLYEKILKTKNHSANLYFNLANSYYKSQKIGPSIYYYEKATNLAPKNKDIQINYGYAKQARLDNIQALPKGFLMRSYESLVKVSVDFWAWLAIISVFLFVIGFIFFYRTYDPAQRKIYFGIWSLSILMALFSLVFAYATESHQQNSNYAIVYNPEVRVQSEPNLRSEQLFKLHEGTKVRILEVVDNWEKIQLADGKIGWIPKKDIKQF